MRSGIPIELFGPHGRQAGTLPLDVAGLVREAEARARTDDISKRSALECVLRQHITEAGCEVSESGLRDAADAVDKARKGDAPSRIQVDVRRLEGGRGRQARPPEARRDVPAERGANSGGPGGAGTPFFELEQNYPSEAARAWYEGLVGLDEHKRRLLVELELLLFPSRLARWSEAHHGTVLRACALYQNRVPLILMHGDVGTGKTALAETIGDALVRHVGGARAHLLKVNTQVRGTGLVGEMSDLIAQAFARAVARAEAAPDEPVLLLIDEADALAASREGQQMHHEDKAGLNTLLQRLDNLRLLRLPVAALFVTNRPEALDPAVRRRAALDLAFERPGDEARCELFRKAVPELRLSRDQLARLVAMTGADREGSGGVPFTASDLTDRLLPMALRAAYTARRKLTPEDLLQAAGALHPTPRFRPDERAPSKPAG